MQVNVIFKENGNILVDDLTKIIRHTSSGENIQITDFNQFSLLKHANFTFIGKKGSLTFRADDVLCVKFMS